MGLTTLPSGTDLPLPDGATVVVIPVYGQHELFAQCLASVLAHTPVDVPLLIADDASPDPASYAWVQELDRAGVLEHALHWARNEENVGFVGTGNAAFARTGRADVVLLNSDCVVAEGWLEGLRGALDSDASIATATALTNHGSIVSVPVRNTPVPALPADTTLERAAAEVRRRSRRLYPRIPTAVGHCFLIRRAALGLVGGFDEAFAPGYGEEVDFCLRCTLAGMQHVVADDVLVLHRGGGTFGSGPEGGPSELQLRHEAIIDARYPFYQQEVREAQSALDSRLAGALALASAAVVGLRVTVDVRSLGPIMTGTQLHALELVHALWRTGRVRLRLLVPEELGEYAKPIIAAMTGVETIRDRETTPSTPRDPIVHRPSQISAVRDLALLDGLGERLVVTHQDLIGYRNAGYHASLEEWTRFRKLTAEALATAAMVLFLSDHAAADARREGLVSEDRVRVARLGADHALNALAPRAPAAADVLAERPFLLCVGTDFTHKNRLFAARLLEALQERHGWTGRLVFCGPHLQHGTSAGAEAAWLASRPGVAGALLDLAAVEEAEKQWLMVRAAAVVYPTTSEGFGLLPFEAAAAGVPCLFAHVSALAELLPAAAATITPWDPERTADDTVALLSAGPERQAHLDLLASAARRLTWDRTAEAILAAYEDTLVAPSRDLARVREQHMRDGRYWELRHQIGPTGMALVGPHEPLLAERTQRALAALARRPLTRRALIGVLDSAHRLTAVKGRSVPPETASEADDAAG